MTNEKKIELVEKLNEIKEMFRVNDNVYGEKLVQEIYNELEYEWSMSEFYYQQLINEIKE